RVGVLDRVQVARAPRLRAVRLDGGDRRAQPRAHGHREPACAGGGLDAIAILPAVLLVLHGVEEDEGVGGGPLGEIAEPRHVLRLVDGELHGFTKIGFASTRCWAPRASTRRTSGAVSAFTRRTARNGVAPRSSASSRPLRTTVTRTSWRPPSLASTAMRTSIGVPGRTVSVSPLPALTAPAVAENSARSKPTSFVRCTAYMRPRRSASSTAASDFSSTRNTV